MLSLLNKKMYISEEFHNEEFKFFTPYFSKKEGYSFAHIAFGKIQNNEFYLSNKRSFHCYSLFPELSFFTCMNIRNLRNIIAISESIINNLPCILLGISSGQHTGGWSNRHPFIRRCVISSRFKILSTGLPRRHFLFGLSLINWLSKCFFLNQ